MAYGACNTCGCAYHECECAARAKAARENAEAERRAQEWVRMMKELRR